VRLVILGATGKTGSLLLEQAIARGHKVVAYVRRPDALAERKGLRVVGGELTDEPALTSALDGADAVLCVIGPTGVTGLIGADLMQRALPVVSAAMAAAGVRRLVLLSAWGVGDTAASASLVAKVAFRTAVRSLYHDKEIAEAGLAATGLDVTTVYPVALTNGPPSDGAVVRDVGEVTHVDGMPRVSRATVARAMLDAVEDRAAIGRRLLVSSAGTVH
jgi:putative NADH-flavin reductase